MYLFPDYAEMETPGKLKSFLADLYSGKLHREFHYGPDKVHHRLPSTWKLSYALCYADSKIVATISCARYQPSPLVTLLLAIHVACIFVHVILLRSS